VRITKQSRGKEALPFGVMALFLLLGAAVGGAFTPGDVVQDRYAYSALIFGAIWLGRVIPSESSSQRLNQPVWLVLITWLITLAFLHPSNLSIWKSNRTLYERAVVTAPDKPRYLMNLSNTLRREGESDPTCSLLLRAESNTRKGKPGGDLVKILFSLGNCHRDAKRIQDAVQAYDASFNLSQNTFSPALENKALAWLDYNRPDKAFDAARELTKVAPKYGRAWHLAGVAAANLQHWEAAEFAFSQAIKIEARDTASREMLRRVQAQKNQAQ
jgi:tetratricopeptide (TPR) repeat protein